MIPTGQAIVTLFESGSVIRRPAALVYRTQRGIGWLEPGFYDPFPPAAPQWHEREGTLSDTESGVFLDSPGSKALIVDAERVRGTELDVPEVRRNLDWHLERLKELNTSPEEQRIIIAAMLSTSLS